MELLTRDKIELILLKSALCFVYSKPAREAADELLGRVIRAAHAAAPGSPVPDPETTRRVTTEVVNGLNLNDREEKRSFVAAMPWVEYFYEQLTAVPHRDPRQEVSLDAVEAIMDHYYYAAAEQIVSGRSAITDPFRRPPPGSPDPGPGWQIPPSENPFSPQNMEGTNSRPSGGRTWGDHTPGDFIPVWFWVWGAVAIAMFIIKIFILKI